MEALQRGEGLQKFGYIINSSLSQCSTAWGLSTRLFCVGPTRIRSCKSYYLFGVLVKLEKFPTLSIYEEPLTSGC